MLACSIFIVLLVSTKLLPPLVNRNGVLLFFNLFFITFFYLTINCEWYIISKPLVWLFMPATLSVGLFFYRFNTLWLKKNLKIDKALIIVPIIILIASIALELILFSRPENLLFRDIRIIFTNTTLQYIFPLYNGLLIILNFYKLNLAERHNRQTYSDPDISNLNWSRISLLFFSIFYLGMIFSELVNPFISELIFNLSILMLVLYLGYYQIKVISNYLNSTKDNQKVKKKESLFVDKGQRDDKHTSLFNKIEQVVEEEQLFLNDSLSIHELGVKLNMNSKYLSEAINQQEDLNFNKYINAKRINYAKSLITDDDYSNYSIEGIAKESGFRSKSTFNTTFKKITGLTPTQYKKMETQK